MYSRRTALFSLALLNGMFLLPYLLTYFVPDVSLIYLPIPFACCVFVAVRAQVSTASLAVIGFADDNLQGQAVGTGADGTTFVLSGTFQTFDVPFTCTSLSLPCSLPLALLLLFFYLPNPPPPLPSFLFLASYSNRRARRNTRLPACRHLSHRRLLQRGRAMRARRSERDVYGTSERGYTGHYADYIGDVFACCGPRSDWFGYIPRLFSYCFGVGVGSEYYVFEYGERERDGESECVAGADYGDE